jgi:hypothetical protein
MDLPFRNMGFLGSFWVGRWGQSANPLFLHSERLDSNQRPLTPQESPDG